MKAAADALTPEKTMLNDLKTPNRFHDAPLDRPWVERIEHANLERPGAQSHPRAAGSGRPAESVKAWRER